MSSQKTQHRRFYTTHGREPGGYVQAWLHMEPATDPGMSSETVAVRCFMPSEASAWSDEDAAAHVRAWAESVLAERGVTEGLS